MGDAARAASQGVRPSSLADHRSRGSRTCHRAAEGPGVRGRNRRLDRGEVRQPLRPTSSADGREWCDTDHAATMTDLRLAARRLLATPLFTVFAVLSLAIGVAVTTAVYSIVDSIFLRDSGAHDPDRLVMVVTPYDGLFVNGSISLPDFQDLRAAQASFTSISASASFTPAVASSFTTELLAAEAVDG